MIKVLLQANPKRRPSCNEILQMPIIEKKIQEFGFEEYKNTDLAANTLLGTIQIPRNLCVLRDKLPKPNYGNKEEKETPGPTFGYFARRNIDLEHKPDLIGQHLCQPHQCSCGCVEANPCSHVPKSSGKPSQKAIKLFSIL